MPLNERIALVDRILDSLDEPDVLIDALWAKEADDRLAAYRRGEIQAAPEVQVKVADGGLFTIDLIRF